jgi:transcription initiation factor IIE alpha subunit
VFSHTVPKFVGVKKQIFTYLKKHEVATEEELAEILKLDIKKINKILLELEREGIIESPQ